MLIPTNTTISNKIKEGLSLFICCFLLSSITANSQVLRLKSSQATEKGSASTAGSFSSKTNAGRSLDSTAQIEERLVQLAYEGPLFKEAHHRNRINELELTRSKRDRINFLTLSANYNDLSFSKDPSGFNQQVFPRYFFGVNIPLGTILSRTDVKTARESIEISKANEETLKRQVRAEVLTKYRQYRAYNELLTLQGEHANDVQASLVQTEEKFRKGTIPVESYTAAQQAKNIATARVVQLQLEQDMIKIDLERMIGTRLEAVIR